MNVKNVAPKNMNKLLPKQISSILNFNRTLPSPLYVHQMNINLTLITHQSENSPE